MTRPLAPFSFLALPLLVPMLPAQWTALAPNTVPPARYYGGMAYDALLGQTVLFGGGTSGFPQLNDTWTFDGVDWTQATPSNAPSARGGFRMVHDLGRGRIVLFGGRGGPGINPPRLADTWEWDGTTWTQVVTANAPSPRDWYAMAYDLQRARTVLYGGIDSNFPIDSNQTWEFDGVNWQQRTPANNPGPLENAAMCFFPPLGKVVLFGGINVQIGGTSTLWGFDGTNWAQVPALGTPPAPRTFANMVFDESRQALIVHGGMNPQTGTLFTDTWQFDGATWTQLPPTGPVGRRGLCLAYDQVRQRTLLFGGLNQAFTGVTDTWYFGPTWESFGFGCPGSAGIPVLAPQAGARVGAPFVNTLFQLVPSAPLAIVATGFSTTTWGPTPLPLNMTPLGMNGCFLFVAPDQLDVIGASGGVANLVLPIPGDPWFFGQVFHQQGFSFELPGFNAFGGVLSNATTMPIGY